MSRFPAWCILVLSTALLAPRSGAQATVTVDGDDLVLARIDRLITEGAVRTAVVGQRPYSRREVARLLEEARSAAEALAPAEPARAQRILALLALDSATYEGEAPGSTRLIERLSVEAVAGGGGAREIPYGGTGQGPLGRIDAITSPLIERRHGRVYNEDATFAVETSHRLQLGRFAALALSPRAWTGYGSYHDPSCVDSCPNTADLRRGRPVSGLALRVAALTTGARNVLVTLGRDHLLLGQSFHGGGLMISDNAPPLDMLRVASDAPFAVPWIFGRLGRLQAVAYLADLGPGGDVSHAKLAGWKISVLASPTLEWGVSVQSQQGGRGAPPASVLQRIVDVIPLVDVLLLQDRDLLFSNKLAGVDVRVRLPRLRGLELYWEGAVDDFDIRRIGSSLTEDAGHVVGIAIPRLRSDGQLRLDVEARHTGLRFYQHEQFPAGLTLNRFIIGDPIGPRACGLAARITRDHGGRAPLMLTWALESRSNDQYVVDAEDHQTAEGFRFRKVEERPEEIRHRAVLSWTRGVRGPALRGRLDLGWEYVHRPGFAPGSANHALLRLGADARF